MSSAKLTLIGFYKYTDNFFEHLYLPEGINKEDVINTILMRGGEYEVLYSDADFLKLSIRTWSNKWYWTFDRWLKATKEEYSPIDNYDRYEEWTDTTNSNSNGENKVSAYNSKTYQPSGSSTNKLDGKNTHNGHIRGNIGVATSASIWKEYQDTQKWNLINQIADIFLKEYVIPIAD